MRMAPRVFVNDWKYLHGYSTPSIYSSIEDVVKLVSTVPDNIFVPEAFTGIAAIIVHSDSDMLPLFAEIAKQNNIPLIFNSSSSYDLDYQKKSLESQGFGNPPIYYLRTYTDVFNKIRELFANPSARTSDSGEIHNL